MHQALGQLPQQVYPLDMASTAFSYAQQPQGTPLQSIVTNSLDVQGSLNPLESSLRRPPTMQLPRLDGFTDATSQVMMLPSNVAMNQMC